MNGKTVEAYLNEVSSEEFSGWLAYEQVYGIPDVYFMTAKICQAIFLAFAGVDKPASDFVPFYADAVEPPSDDDDEIEAENAENMRRMAVFRAAMQARLN